MQAACKLVGVLGLPALEQVLDQQQLLLCDDHRKTNDRAISKLCDEVAISNTIQLLGRSRNAVDLARQKKQASQTKKEATWVQKARMYAAVVEEQQQLQVAVAHAAVPMSHADPTGEPEHQQQQQQQQVSAAMEAMVDSDTMLWQQDPGQQDPGQQQQDPGQQQQQQQQEEALRGGENKRTWRSFLGPDWRSPMKYFTRTSVRLVSGTTNAAGVNDSQLQLSSPPHKLQAVSRGTKQPGAPSAPAGSSKQQPSRSKQQPSSSKQQPSSSEQQPPRPRGRPPTKQLYKQAPSRINISKMSLKQLWDTVMKNTISVKDMRNKLASHARTAVRLIDQNLHLKLCLSDQEREDVQQLQDARAKLTARRHGMYMFRMYDYVLNMLYLLYGSPDVMAV